MDDRVAALRRKIALLQRYLREGTDADMASIHLRQIAEAQLEIEELERRPRL